MITHHVSSRVIQIRAVRVFVGRNSFFGQKQELKSTVNMTTRASFQTWEPDQAYAKRANKKEQPGGKAFAECEMDAVRDLFHGFAKKDDDSDVKYLDMDGVRELLNSIGERPDEKTLQRLYKAADYNGDGVIELHVSKKRENSASISRKVEFLSNTTPVRRNS